MTLLTYQVFKTVAEKGNFHKAAEVLGLTPSAISHAICSLEEELGFSVLTRGKGGVALTNAGEHFLPYVNAVLNSDESLKQFIAEANGLKAGKIKIGVFSSVCTNWLPDVLQTFKEMYPHIVIEVFQGSYDDVYTWIKKSVVDIGFLSVSSAKDLPIEPLCKDPLLCVLPKGMKTSGKYMTIDEMKNHSFVTQREETEADIQAFLKDNDLTVQSNYHVIDDLSTVRLVEKGLGICLMPKLCMEDIPYDVDVFPIQGNPCRIIGIATLNPTFMAPAVRTMYNHIIEKYRTIQ